MWGSNSSRLFTKRNLNYLFCCKHKKHIFTTRLVRRLNLFQPSPEVACSIPSQSFTACSQTSRRLSADGADKTQTSQTESNSEPPANFTTYYDILGVKKTATYYEIDKAYKKLRRMHHPEHNKGEGGQMYSYIAEAYSVLNDPEGRKEYDKSLDNPDTTTWDKADDKDLRQFYQIYDREVYKQSKSNALDDLEVLPLSQSWRVMQIRLESEDKKPVDPTLRERLRALLGMSGMFALVACGGLYVLYKRGGLELPLEEKTSKKPSKSAS